MDRLALLGEHAIALALALVAAYAAAYCREIAVAVDDGHRVAEVALGQFGNPFGDVVADGAAFLAVRYLAAQATLCLADCLG